jgi:hypothetical protein
VTASEIEQQIRSGQLFAHDLVYREHDVRWREAIECVEFSHLFKKTKKERASTVTETLWVLLTRKSDNSGYKQRGPLSTIEIARALENGEVSSTDYVWREGLKEWYKILTIDEIQSTRAALRGGASTQNAVSFEPPPPPPLVADEPEPVTEPPPESIAEPVESTTTRRQIRRGQRRPPSREAKAARISMLRHFLEMAPIGKALVIVGALVFVFGGVLASLWFSSYQDRENAKLAPPKLAEVPGLPKEAPVPAAAPPVVAAKPAVTKEDWPEPQKLPTFVQIEKAGNGGDDVVLKLATDASSHFDLILVIESLLGQNLEGFSFYRRLVLHGVAARNVSIKSLGLSPGRYRASVEVDKVKVSAVFDWSTNAKDYRQKLQLHRKQLAYQFGQERVGFVKLANHLQSEIIKFAQSSDTISDVGSWREFSRSWRKSFDRIQNRYLTEISNKTRQQFILAGLWLQLKELKVKVDHEVAAIEQARKAHKTTTSASVRALAQSIVQLKDQAIQASLWR